MKPIKISVIIPHYNIPQLLMRCIKSIPVREDIQVIVVDDCSPNAGSYITNYPELSRPYVEFYSTPKGGSAGRARNIGIDHAKGEWLTFIDADDFFPENIETLFDELTTRPEDLIFTNFMTVMSDDTSIVSSRNSWYHDIFDKYFTDKEESALRYKFDSMWGKLVRKTIVDQNYCRFSETRWSNDCYFSVYVGIIANSIYVDKRIGYILTERKGSLAGNYCGTIEEAAVRMDVALCIRQLLEKHQLIQFSPTFYLEKYLQQKFDKISLMKIALKLRKHPRYMLHLFLSICKS